MSRYPFLAARKRGGSGGSGAPAYAMPIKLSRAPAKAGALAIISNAPAFAGAHTRLEVRS